MLDLPELFVPARIVSGLISILCSWLIDLKPETESLVIPFCSDAEFFMVFSVFAISPDLCH